MEIIRLNPEKWQEYKDIRKQAIENAPLAFSPVSEYKNYSDEDWKQEFLHVTSHPYLTLFAEIDGELVGMCGRRCFQEPNYQHNAEIQGLYVTPKCRAMGIGKALLEMIVSDLRGIGTIKNVFSEIISSQKASVVIHQQLGFKIVGRQEKIVKCEREYYDNIFLQMKLE